MMYSRIQSPGFWIPGQKLAGFRNPQAKFAGLRNPNFLLWGEGRLKTQEFIASIFLHFSLLYINTCKLHVHFCRNPLRNKLGRYKFLIDPACKNYCFLDPAKGLASNPWVRVLAENNRSQTSHYSCSCLIPVIFTRS